MIAVDEPLLLRETESTHRLIHVDFDIVGISQQAFVLALPTRFAPQFECMLCERLLRIGHQPIPCRRDIEPFAMTGRTCSERAARIEELRLGRLKLTTTTLEADA